MACGPQEHSVGLTFEDEVGTASLQIIKNSCFSLSSFLSLLKCYMLFLLKCSPGCDFL